MIVQNYAIELLHTLLFASEDASLAYQMDLMMQVEFVAQNVDLLGDSWRAAISIRF